MCQVFPFAEFWEFLYNLMRKNQTYSIFHEKFCQCINNYFNKIQKNYDFLHLNDT